MPREFTRSDRVAAQLQRDLAELLRSGLDEPVLGIVTVNAVEVTRDMSLAKIYVSFLAAKEPVKACIKILIQHIPQLRHEIGKRMRLRVLPEFRFIYDESLERGLKIQALLNGLEGSAASSREVEAGERE